MLLDLQKTVDQLKLTNELALDQIRILGYQSTIQGPLTHHPKVYGGHAPSLSFNTVQSSLIPYTT